MPPRHQRNLHPRIWCSMPALKTEVAVILRMAVAAVVLASLMLGATQSGSAQAQADFFRGKTLTMLIGYTSGGGYDLYARVLSKHLGRHIPGRPSIVPQNRPDAWLLRAPH